jgi:protein involved in polysaccharide export with SLBB domain
MNGLFSLIPDSFLPPKVARNSRCAISNLVPNVAPGGAGAPPHFEDSNGKTQFFLICILSLLFATVCAFPSHAAETNNPAKSNLATNTASPSVHLTAPPSDRPTAPSPAATMDTLDDKHHLAIGDRVSFRIVEDEIDPNESRDPKPLFVTDSGELEVPYLGRVPAETKTCKQLAFELKAALEKDYYYHATVLLAIDLMAKSRGKIYLAGPVRAPGPQEIPSDEVLTLSKAITRAGGFTDFADKRNVKVIRKGPDGNQQTLIVDVGAILDKGKIERDIPLEAGDLILVNERAIRF